jgi:acyl-CoA hydrolase
VTEYGVAELRGKSAKQRAAALIGIAHPDFRGELREAARQMRLI